MKNKHLMTGFAVILLVYAGWRSFDYMVGSLQGVSPTIAILVSLIFLFASEIGLLVWLYYAAPNANTEIQETTAKVMIGINFIGSMILGLADLLKHNTLYTVDLAILDPILLLAPWVMIAANVLGHIIYHQSDSFEMMKRAERQLSHEESKLEIEARTRAIAELHKNRDALADKLAPHYYNDLTDRVTGRTMKRFTRAAGQLKRNQADRVPDLLTWNTETVDLGADGNHPKEKIKLTR